MYRGHVDVVARILPTRNGNKKIYSFIILPPSLHGSYLQGMETRVWCRCGMKKARHGSYLQGMETRVMVKYRQHAPNCTDPTYKEWKLTSSNSISGIILDSARILPTRNGNWGASHAPHGWAVIARILPTRNGNIFIAMKTTSQQPPTHGSYLQGMETANTATNAWRLQIARILPTRNGNIQ